MYSVRMDNFMCVQICRRVDSVVWADQHLHVHGHECHQGFGNSGSNHGCSLGHGYYNNKGLKIG